MNWFNIIKDNKNKKNTTQTKLPEELIDGATVASRPASKWFKVKPKPTKVISADKQKPDSKQTTLKLTEE